MPDHAPGAAAAAGAAPPAVVVTLPAEIDLGNSSLVHAELATALARQPEVVIADGTRTRFCDCAAITALIAAHHQAAAAAAQLRVVITSGHVQRVLALTGADQVLLVYPSLGAAQADGTPQTHAGQPPSDVRSPARQERRSR